MNRAVLLVLANLAVMGCGKKAGSSNIPHDQRNDCSTDTDCTQGEDTWCMKSGDASTGKCYPQPREGRPLAIAGEVHVAKLSHAPSDDAELARLRASIAAFARTIAELMALGAPLSLLDETQRALADEIRHTDRTLDRLEELTGKRPTFEPLERNPTLLAMVDDERGRLDPATHRLLAPLFETAFSA